MRIAIATAVYYPQVNGVAVFSHNLARGLVQRGHEVMVITPSQTGRSYTEVQDGVKVAYIKSMDVKVYPDQIHEVPEKKKLFYKNGLRVSLLPRAEVRKVLDEFRPDVVHVQVADMIGLSVVAYARRHRIPVVTTEHNQPEVLTESLHLPRVMKQLSNVALSAYFRKRHSKSDFVTMPTEKAIRVMLKKKDLGVPVAAVSNGVDLTAFRPGRAPKEIYEKYGIPQRVPIVLYIGRVDPEKQVGLVIEAFNEARKKVPKAEMVIVGDGVDRVRLEKVAGRQKDVHFLGRVLPPDLYDLYKVGTVFVTASEVETQGIVLIEAAATGLPLIAVNKGAVVEACRNGENGFLCRPGAVDEMAEAMVKVMTDDDLRRRFGEKSLEIAKLHDFETTLDRFINIYNRVTRK